MAHRMTVAELVDILNRMPPDARVCFYDGEIGIDDAEAGEARALLAQINENGVLMRTAAAG